VDDLGASLVYGLPPDEDAVSADEAPRETKGGRVDEDHLFGRLLASKWWRLNNLYWIKTKKGRRIKFRPNRHQMRLWYNLHRRNVLLKCRQLGMTTFVQISMLDDCLFIPDTNAGTIAHKEDAAKAIFEEKVKFAYDNLPPFVKEMMPATNDTASSLRFPNGSALMVGTSLRSGTYQLMHLSEYGRLCQFAPERAEEVKTGAIPTVPDNGCLIVESTAAGRTGHFFEICKRAANHQGPLTPKHFRMHFYPWWEESEYRIPGGEWYGGSLDEYFERLAAADIHLTPEQKLWYAVELETYQDRMRSEYPSYWQEAFEASIEGAYFNRAMAQARATGRICRVPIDPMIPIETFWDLGRDTTAIWFYQRVGLDYRFVDYFQASGEGIEYYVHMLKNKRDGLRPLNYGTAFLPHDGDRKSLASSQSVAEVLYDNGFEVHIVRRTPSKQQSIERARRLIPQCFFDEERCREGTDCLDEYRKEWDARRGDWQPNPVHHAASHGADAFMVFADSLGIDIDAPAEEREMIRASATAGASGRNPRTGY